VKKKNPFLCILLASIMLSTLVLVAPVEGDVSTYSNISIKEANNLIKHDPNTVILDVRNQSEYNLGHLCNSMNAPLFKLQESAFIWANPPSLPGITRPNVNDTILVYCLSGTRSSIACQILAQNGFTHVYNLDGGINAWLAEGYPISTTLHDAIFTVENGDTFVDIKPNLQSNCGCPGNQTPSCTDNSIFNYTRSIVAESNNHTMVRMDQSYKGIQRDYTIDQNILWKYNVLTNDLNRTLIFSSTQVTNENSSASTQIYSLREDSNVKDEYNLTIVTTLIPLDSQTYNSSFTNIIYMPANVTKAETLETIRSNSTITLSQLYNSLSEVTKKLARDYGKSQDTSLNVYHDRYRNIALELSNIANLVETNLGAYNRNILRTVAILQDDWLYCVVCSSVILSLIYIGTCVAAIACLPGLGETLCAYVLELGIGELGAEAICEQVLSCNLQYTPNYEVLADAWSGVVWPPYSDTQWVENMIGDQDGGDARLITTGYEYFGDMAQAIGIMTQNVGEYAHGEIEVYCCCSYEYDGDSCLQVWVSQDDSSWAWVGVHAIDYTTGYHWEDYGYFNGCFRYMAIVKYDPFVSMLLVDSVRVTP
jgi:rhodanese-related sulfurtransferase